MKLIFKLILTLLFAISPIGFSSPDITQNRPQLVSPDTVTLTVYKLDDYIVKPPITASGILLDETNPKSHNIIAVSRDLLGKYNFGDSVYLSGAGEYDGVYIIEDLMHYRWSNRIDILINIDDPITKLDSVVIHKL